MKSEAYAVEQYICDLCLSVWSKYDEYKAGVTNFDEYNTDKIKLVLKCYFELSEKFNGSFEEWTLSCLVIEQKLLLLVQKYVGESFISKTGYYGKKGRRA